MGISTVYSMSSIISIASFLYLLSFAEYVNSISVAAGKTEKEHRELCSVTVSNEIQGRNNTPCVFPFIFEGVKYLSTNLKEKKYFVGDHFNIADVSGFTCLEYLDLRFPKFKWRDQYKNLVVYWNIHKDRQSFKETKPVAQIIEPLDD